MKNPNPQGKGLSPILDGLNGARARITLPPKQLEQVCSELFTSLFVLKARFDFRPVAGQSYWLYFTDKQYKLFSTAPYEWASGQPGIFIGECILREDVTWTIKLDEAILEEEWFVGYVQAEQQKVRDALFDADQLQQAMPVYLEELPYYSRLLAYGAGTSLKESMNKAGIDVLNYEQANALLTDDKNK